MIRTVMLLALTYTSAVYAASAGHGDGHGVPWTTIAVQAFNFLLLMGILVFALRKTVKAHFATRAQEYTDLVQRAEVARKQAETAKKEVEARLARLESSSVDTVKQAEAEAGVLKARMAEEAQQMARKLEQEAQRTAAVELEKAKAELRRELLQRALANSKESLAKNLGSNEQKKLQNEFVEKIQVVSG